MCIFFCILFFFNGVHVACSRKTGVSVDILGNGPWRARTVEFGFLGGSISQDSLATLVAPGHLVFQTTVFYI